jgi:cytosine/adenosine deaminase-related metal-dependent hydrolase
MSEPEPQGVHSAPAPADLLVLGGIVVTMDEQRTILPRGGLAIRDGRIVAAMAALEMATIGGARALKLDHLVGSLEPGKRADVVVVELDEDNLVPLYDPVSHLAYAVEAADVRTVLVDGRIVVREGKLTTADEAEIRSQVRAVARDIGSLRDAERR